MKKYIVIAGVNGAGKSTLYQMYEVFKDMSIMEIVNLGEISRRTAYRYKPYYDEINTKMN